MTIFDRLRTIIANQIRPCDCRPAVADDAPPIRILNTDGPVRSLECEIDPTGTRGHVCTRRDGQPLYQPSDTCFQQACEEMRQDVEFERRKAQLVWAMSEVNSVFANGRAREILHELRAEAGHGPWDHPSFDGDAT